MYAHSVSCHGTFWLGQGVFDATRVKRKTPNSEVTLQPYVHYVPSPRIPTYVPDIILRNCGSIKSFEATEAAPQCIILTPTSLGLVWGHCDDNFLSVVRSITQSQS